MPSCSSQEFQQEYQGVSGEAASDVILNASRRTSKRISQCVEPTSWAVGNWPSQSRWVAQRTLSTDTFRRNTADDRHGPFEVGVTIQRPINCVYNRFWQHVTKKRRPPPTRWLHCWPSSTELHRPLLPHRLGSSTRCDFQSLTPKLVWCTVSTVPKTNLRLNFPHNAGKQNKHKRFSGWGP